MPKQQPAAAAPAAAPEADKPQFTRAFFAQEGSKTPVSLVIDPKNPNFEPGRPALFGTIGEKNVSIFVEPAGKKGEKEYGAFLSINVRGENNGDGTYGKDTKFGTGNLVVTKDGFARLAIKQAGSDEAIWAIPRKEVTQEQLAAAGLDLAKLADVKAAVAATKAAAPADEKKAAAKP